MVCFVFRFYVFAFRSSFFVLRYGTYKSRAAPSETDGDERLGRSGRI